MNKAMKKRWITALRSGEYQQAQCRLHDLDGSMCCMGVLCDIEIDDDWELVEGCYKIQGHTGYLPAELIKQSGLSLGVSGYLSMLNDAKRMNFAQIADYIEDHL